MLHLSSFLLFNKDDCVRKKKQEICAARSLGKRVFRDKVKIATKARKLHYFWKIYVIYDASSLFGLETTNIKAQCYVHKSPKHTQVKKEKLTTYMHSSAHLKSSRRYAYCHGQVEQADCENMLLQAPRGLAVEVTLFCGYIAN